MSRTPDSGTWWERQVPSTGSPSTVFGPVQPFGVRSTIMGQRGFPAAPVSRASRWIRAMPVRASSSAAAISRCMTSGSSPDTMIGSWPYPWRSATRSASGMRASTAGLAIL